MMEFGKTKLPIDRGWAWIVLIAVFITMFIILGQMKCYGIFFVLLQQRFNSTSSMTSLVFLLQEIAFSLTAFILSTLGRKLSYRLTTVTGAILATCMYLLIGFADRINLAFLSSIGVGISNGFIYPAAFAMVSTYFVKRRGLANSICNSGLSVGGLVLAPFYTLIIETYGFTGTYLYVAAVHLNVTVAAMLFRPLEFYSQPVRTRENGALIDSNLDSDLEKEGREIFNMNSAKLPESTRESVINTAMNQEEVREPENGELDDLIRQTKQYQQNKAVHGDENETHYRKQLTKQIKVDKEQSDEVEKSFNRSGIRTFLSKLVSLDLLKDFSFIYYLVANIFLCAGNSLVPGYVPPHAFENGVSPEQISILVSGPAILDLIFRPIFGLISDTGWVKRTTMVAMASGVVGVACQLFYLMKSFERILPFSLLIGLCQGIYYSLFVVILLEIIEMKQLKSALGFTCLIQGLSNAVSLLLAGFIRDYSGSYTSTYNFIGSLLLVGALMIYFLPAVHRRSSRMQTEKTES